MTRPQKPATGPVSEPASRLAQGPDQRPDQGPDSAPAPGYAVFVARSTYRQRRMIDAAGMLPVLGALLFALPLLWPGGQEAGGAAQGIMGDDMSAPDAALTSHVMIYVFVVWAGLVILSALITRGLRARQGAPEDGAGALDDPARDGAPDGLQRSARPVAPDPSDPESRKP